MGWQQEFKDKLLSPAQAAGLVKSGQHLVFSLNLKPRDTALEVARRAGELRGVRVVSNWNEDYPWLHPGMEESFSVKEGFVLRPSREPVRQRRVDWVPVIFGLYDGVRQEDLARTKLYHHADIFFLKLTPPNPRGYCSFGHAVWYSPTGLRSAKTVVAEIDPGLPWTYGDFVHVSEIDYLVETPASRPEEPPPALPTPDPQDWERCQVIGALAADLVRDGATLQIGIGAPSEAVMDFLGEKNDLGVDSELIYPPIVELVQRGVITGQRKTQDRGRVTTSCLWLYPGDPRARPALDFIDHNPLFEFWDISRLCFIPRLARNDNMVAINSALCLDLLGQAAIDHLGPTPIAGPGGQVEFCIASHYSRGGRSITCLLSTALDGKASRIVPRLEAGTVVQVPLTYIDFVVTEQGVANLEGKSRRERAEALIEVAHPDFRPELRRAAREMFWP